MKMKQHSYRSLDYDYSSHSSAFWICYPTFIRINCGFTLLNPGFQQDVVKIILAFIPLISSVLNHYQSRISSQNVILLQIIGFQDKEIQTTVNGKFLDEDHKTRH